MDSCANEKNQKSDNFRRRKYLLEKKKDEFIYLIRWIIFYQVIIFLRNKDNLLPSKTLIDILSIFAQLFDINESHTKLKSGWTFLHFKKGCLAYGTKRLCWGGCSYGVMVKALES